MIVILFFLTYLYQWSCALHFQGHRIQASISYYGNKFLLFHRIFSSGKCYEIKNLIVSKISKTDMLVGHLFKLNFCNDTTVKSIKDEGFPKFSLQTCQMDASTSEKPTGFTRFQDIFLMSPESIPFRKFFIQLFFKV